MLDQLQAVLNVEITGIRQIENRYEVDMVYSSIKGRKHYVLIFTPGGFRSKLIEIGEFGRDMDYKAPSTSSTGGDNEGEVTNIFVEVMVLMRKTREKVELLSENTSSISNKQASQLQTVCYGLFNRIVEMTQEMPSKPQNKLKGTATLSGF